MNSVQSKNKDITNQRAHELLEEAAALNPGPWVAHSLNAARAAEIIARRIKGLDPEQAYTMGLLHDIGRRVGVTGMRHVYDGCQFLTAQGYPDPARICLTHSYPIEGMALGAGEWDGTAEELAFVEERLRAQPYDDYDRLIQLCDAISLPEGYCLMEKRLVDVTQRHGFNEHTLPRWRGFFAVKERLERAAGVSIYSLLPGVVEITFKVEDLDSFLPGPNNV